MKKLFAVLLGGRAEGCHIELHDIVFTVAESIEAAQPHLQKKWFGNPYRLHIDAYIELNQIDGYDVLLSKEKPFTTDTDKTLYFINFGGYQKNLFDEVHQRAFYVAESKISALQRAKSELCINLSEQHCDDNLVVDDILRIDAIDNYYVELKPRSIEKPIEIVSKYQKLT